MSTSSPDRPPLLTAMAHIVLNWERADPRDTAPEGADALLEAVAPLVAPADVGPLRAAVAAKNPHACGAVAELYRLDLAAIDTLIERGKEYANTRAWGPLLQMLPHLEALSRAIGRNGPLAWAEFFRALSCRHREDRAGAIAAYERALSLAPDEDPKLRSTLHDNLGRLLRETGEYDAALESFREALRIEQNPANRAIILGNQAELFRTLGELGEADRLNLEAAALLSGSEPKGEALDSQAQLVAKAGDVDHALELNSRAGALFGANQFRARAINARIRAMLLLNAGRTDEATTQYREALTLYRREAEAEIDPNDYRSGWHKSRKSRVSETHPAYRTFFAAFQLQARGQFRQALDALDAAANLAEAAGDRALALRIRAHLGSVLFDIGDFRRALGVLEQVQAVARHHGLALPEISALGTQASISQSGADVQIDALAALCRAAYLQEVLAAVLSEQPMGASERRYELNDSGTIENQLGKMAEGDGIYAVAAEFSEIAVRKVEELNDPFRLANRLTGLRLACTKIGDKTRADAAAQRLRVLLESGKLPPPGRIVAGRSLADHIGCDDPALALHYLEIAATAAEEIRASAPPAQRGSIDRQWRDLFWRLSGALRAVGREREAFEALQMGKARILVEAISLRASGDGQPPNLDQVQNLLGPDEALVDVIDEGEALVGYVVTKNGLTSVAIPGRAETLAAPDRGDVRERASALLDMARRSELLTAFGAAAEAALPEGARLLIAPDPRLSNLPLHVIPIGSQPWCEVRRMGQVPAAGVLRLKPEGRRGAVFVAGDSRGDLPGAEAECREIAGLYGVRALTGQACTKAALLGALRAGPLDVVHLALHGRGNPHRGVQASLLMADGSGGTSWVMLDELMKVRWDVGLVVLAGCSTSVSGPRDGHELVSVASQILQGGAGSVVACLWPVGDAATQVAMVAFHKALRQAEPGGDVRAALDAARTALRHPAAPVTALRDGRNVSPERARRLDPVIERDLNWAAFVSFGPPRPFVVFT